MPLELTNFCSDPQLVELFELAKSSNDILDLLTPRENQHSDVLAWCFNAREGHGQGDAILKDFLVAAFQAATENEAGDRLFGRGLSRDFVRAWPPARVMTSSFATAVCYREYTLPKFKGRPDQPGRRLDLLVIDPDNHLLIIVENKAGARFRNGQLTDYLDSIQEELASRAVFRDFSLLSVALDRYFDPDSDSIEDENFDRRWVRINYDWLHPASMRAELAVERGNQSGAVVLSYCRRQTGWESAEMRTMTRIARDLAIRFPSVVGDLKRIARDLLQPEFWTAQLLRPDNMQGQLLKLYLQNQRAINWLISLSPLQLLHARLVEHFPEIGKLGDVWEYGRVWMDYQLPLDESMPKIDSRWPLYLNLKHLNPEIEGRPQFRVRLIWRPQYVPEAERDSLSKALSEIYPAAKGSANRRNAVRLFDEAHASLEDSEVAVKKIIDAICKRIVRPTLIVSDF